ncbi:peptidoglycan-binding protein [candidate division TA06 bacterium]|nr:peptidoglycan-binding protein [candidate division TA06 bacterium]
MASSSRWKTLRIGMKGMEVRRLQRGLKRIGYAITVDGDFGPITRNVVKAFQRHFRRQQVTGVADLETIMKIKNLL